MRVCPVGEFIGSTLFPGSRYAKHAIKLSNNLFALIKIDRFFFVKKQPSEHYPFSSRFSTGQPYASPFKETEFFVIVVIFHNIKEQSWYQRGYEFAFCCSNRV